MKNIALISVSTILTLFISCSQPCECFSFAEPLRLAILNTKNENLLDSSNSNRLIINRISNKLGVNLKFEIHASIFSYLQTTDENYFNTCINQEGSFYISYENSPTIDTIRVLIEKEMTKNNGCSCTGFPYRYIKHNGKLITEFDINNKTGAAIIRK